MKYYSGLDVSVKETSVCIIDETGKICREVKVVSHPDDLIAALSDPAWQIERIGLEAGPLSQWLFEGLANAGLPVVCIETRHTKAFLKAQTMDEVSSLGVLCRSHYHDQDARKIGPLHSTDPICGRSPSRKIVEQLF